MSQSNENQTRTDREELREVIKAFLDQYQGPRAGTGKTRMQKLVFFGDLYCLHEYGRRLTDAEFKPYYHGSFAEEISDILENADGIEEFQSSYSRYSQYRNTEPPEISEEKLSIIETVFEQTKDMSDRELEKCSKGSWLYENTEFDTPMDFESYQKRALVSPTKWRALSLDDRNPVANDADSVADLVN